MRKSRDLAIDLLKTQTRTCSYCSINGTCDSRIQVYGSAASICTIGLQSKVIQSFLYPAKCVQTLQKFRESFWAGIQHYC